MAGVGEEKIENRALANCVKVIIIDDDNDGVVKRIQRHRTAIETQFCDRMVDNCNPCLDSTRLLTHTKSKTSSGRTAIVRDTIAREKRLRFTWSQEVGIMQIAGWQLEIGIGHRVGRRNTNNDAELWQHRWNRSCGDKLK